MTNALQSIQKVSPGAYIDMVIGTPLNDPSFDQVRYEERFFTCFKCKAEMKMFVAEAPGALKVECPKCFETYWWSRKQAKLYQESTRREFASVAT